MCSHLGFIACLFILERIFMRTGNFESQVLEVVPGSQKMFNQYLMNDKIIMLTNNTYTSVNMQLLKLLPNKYQLEYKKYFVFHTEYILSVILCNLILMKLNLKNSKNLLFLIGT